MSFLDADALQRLTGWRRKSKQVDYLRASGIPFRINASGHPVVAWSAVEGGRGKHNPQPETAPEWRPAVLGA